MTQNIKSITFLAINNIMVMAVVPDPAMATMGPILLSMQKVQTKLR